MLKGSAALIPLLSAALLVVGVSSCKRNRPPQPPTIEGPATARPGDTLTFTVKTADPDDDIVSYLIVWGDTGSVEWTPEYPSGQKVTRSKVYSDTGDYLLKAKARDSHEAESDWSEPFLVQVTEAQTPPPATPGAPLGPDSTWTGASTVFRVSTTSSKGNIRYVMNWSDAIDTGDVSYASGETATVAHVWNTPGTYSIKVQAILDADPAKASDFSPAKSVKVILNNAPVVDSVQAPPVAVKDAETFFTVYGSDADGDSLRVIVNWGSGDTTTELFSTPCNVRVSHVFTQIETAMVIVEVQDWKGAKSAPSTVRVPVGSAGGVTWYWRTNPPAQGALTTSAIVTSDGEEEVVMSGCEGDYKFYSIRAAKGKTKKSVTTKGPEYSFIGHPGLNVANHIIVGSDEGELYALKLDGLGKAWQYPDSASERGTNIPWGAPAFNGYNIYIGHEDDSLFLFEDAGLQGNRVAAYGIHASVVDAPIIDATGNVIFGTDSGYLIKMAGNLSSPLWRTPLLADGDVHGPILGSDGTIYCTDDSSRLYAIDPADGHKLWTTTLEGDAVRPALGQSAIFVGSDLGVAYSVNPATGSINWQKTLKMPYGPDEQFSTTPIVTANGYVYFQSENDVLYCLNQADGTVIWPCDCPRYLPRSGGGNSHRPGKQHLTDYLPNPSICANGNVIVIGADAAYCVAGYPEGPLDAAAAWPKWQKNLGNTGK